MLEDIYKTCNHRFHEGERTIPITSFHKDKSSKDGHVSKCKECAKRLTREYADANKKTVLAKQRARYAERVEDYKAYNKQYYQQNKEQIIANVQEYVENNYEDVQARRADHYKRNRERVLERCKEYGKRERGKVLAVQARRRAALLQAVPLWAVDEKENIDALYEQARELSRKNTEQYHVDHIVPLTSKYVCGLHCLDNLQILTSTENLKKHNKFNLT